MLYVASEKVSLNLDCRINAGRVGSCSLFDTDYPSLIADYALPADWETNCHILN